MKKNKTLTIATRKSPLALKQTEIIQTKLIKMYPDLQIKILSLTTQGDKTIDTSLNQLGGKGLFIKELEEALAGHKADIAIHSMKDVPMSLPEGFILPVICEREDPRDVFVANDFKRVDDLPSGAVVGTASLRRKTQLLGLKPELKIKLLRGNINTRLRKLDEKEYDAIILAAAGLKRLNFTERLHSFLSLEECLPAAGQAALGIECRRDDKETFEMIQPLNEITTHACVNAERAVVRYLGGGGCNIPIAAYAYMDDKGILVLQGLIASPLGSKIIRAKEKGSLSEAQALGEKVALDLFKQGARAILDEFNGFV